VGALDVVVSLFVDVDLARGRAIGVEQVAQQARRDAVAEELP
jgi:hypothetical protein